MATSPPSITALPTPPDPDDRATFNTHAYPWSVAQQTLATQVSAVATNVYDNALGAADSAALAAAKELLTNADTVATAADAVATAADRVQTGLDRAAVESISATAGVASINGATGAVTGITDLTTAQTLTNKTISGASNTLTVDDTNAVGFRNIPQLDKTTTYPIVLGDEGNHIHKGGTTAFTVTIPANAAGGGVGAFPIGAALTFVNSAASGVLTIAITSDTMKLAGTGATGSRFLAAYGVATAIKVKSTEWVISGTNLT